MEKQNYNGQEYSEPPITIHLSILYEIAHKNVKNFPKHERYSIGEKIESAILDCIELAISTNIATKYDREKYLVRLGAKIDMLKVLIRLSLNLQFIGLPDYLQTEKRLKELGRMTGGWIRFMRRET